MAPAHSEESLRPETDYERWLREQGKNYVLQEEPVYGPDIEDLDDSTENSQGAGRSRDGDQSISHGSLINPSLQQPITPSTPSSSPSSRFLGLSNCSTTCNVILSVLLTLVLIKMAKAFRKRRR
ncbi:uncharacterized protein BDV17DRAFT_225215 [Aspergillus undulatus]|uniref:uncharacterized protein n=1 Tax=Aspergillus undulatus TaxID=1810928 RepID=UPI003CCD017A